MIPIRAQTRGGDTPCQLDGQAFTALNGGPMFRFNEAISLQVHGETQAEVDYYWEKAGALRG